MLNPAIGTLPNSPMDAPFSRRLPIRRFRSAYDPQPAQRFFEAGTALARVLEQAPYIARCSDDKTATLCKPREYAIRYPYMQINQREMKAWLIFDLDHSNPYIWRDEGLPPPNLIVRNRDSNAAHLFYAIEQVCTSINARHKPVAYMKAIYEAMAIRLGADPAYHSGPVAKTPGHPWWATEEIHPQEYSLGELADSLELETKPRWSASPDLGKVEHSRHCILFELLRFYAYSIVNGERSSGSFQSFSARLEGYAHTHNAFAQYGFSIGDNQLVASSIKATVKSVSNWTWNIYSGSGRCHRGVMALDKALPLTERQRLAADRTHHERLNGTAARIRQACEGLIRRGEKLTYTAIGVLVQLSRQTVAKYKGVIERMKAPQPAVERGDSDAPTSVKYAVYQVTAQPTPVAAPVQVQGNVLLQPHALSVDSFKQKAGSVDQGPAVCPDRRSSTVASSCTEVDIALVSTASKSRCPPQTVEPQIMGSFCSIVSLLRRSARRTRGF